MQILLFLAPRRAVQVAPNPMIVKRPGSGKFVYDISRNLNMFASSNLLLKVTILEIQHLG